MDMIANGFLWTATHFTGDLYLTATKAQALVWSGADLVLIFVFLRIASLLREREGLDPAQWRYALLAATALVTPLLMFATTSRQILWMESAICGTQFLLLVFTLVRDRRRFLALILDERPIGEKEQKIE